MSRATQIKGGWSPGFVKRFIVFILKSGAVLLAVATPLIGVWVSSSLAAYVNGPIWLTILIGLLLFPLLPLVWEGFAAWHLRRKKIKLFRILTFFDRIILRTLTINLIFITILLAARPEIGFTALQARGDWMLEGVEAPWARTVRSWLLATADRLEWLYDLAQDNPYAKSNPDKNVLPTDDSRLSTDDGQVEKAPPAKAGETHKKIPSRESKRSDVSEQEREPSQAIEIVWPTEATIHPVVASMPQKAETNIASVADYIKIRENGKLGRIRAIHDWVADRIEYDVTALKTERIPNQEPEQVFKSRKGVCSGYSLLMRAFGRHLGLEVVYIAGVSRGLNGTVGGGGHAWNAVKLGEAWYLIDTTWDAGLLKNGRFEKQFSTRYFLTPPEIFGLNHFPESEQWQLREQPLTRGEFIRQPILDPNFYINKMKMLQPTRSQITVDSEAVIRVANPSGLFMLANFRRVDSNDNSGTRCQVNDGPEVSIRCRFPSPGNYRVMMFMNREPSGAFSYAGQVLVNRS